jgi:hypothetical protein
VKVGVSGGKISKAGESYRARRQVNRWNRSQPGRYRARVVKTESGGPGARRRILDWEKDRAKRLRAKRQLTDPRRHKRP